MWSTHVKKDFWSRTEEIKIITIDRKRHDEKRKYSLSWRNAMRHQSKLTILRTIDNNAIKRIEKGQ